MAGAHGQAITTVGFSQSGHGSSDLHRPLDDQIQFHPEEC